MPAIAASARGSAFAWSGRCRTPFAARLAAAVWAAVRATSGAERFELDRVEGKVTHEIVIRYRGDVAPEMRLRAGTRIFDIRAAVDPDARRRWLRCLAEERDL